MVDILTINSIYFIENILHQDQKIILLDHQNNFAHTQK